jgi:A/G-specific adenine glycosylase
VRSWCRAHAEGAPEAYPVKAPKAARPHRRGTAWWLEHDGEVLLVRRPARGLLGGMIALPEVPPVAAAWEKAGAVEHVFTHFSLTMTLQCARTGARPGGIWHPVETIAEAGLPTLFAKLAARGLAWREKGMPDEGVRENTLLV